MTGVYFVLSPCFACGRPFTYNPHLVPSVPILPDGSVGPGGTREPICRSCVERVNIERERNGLELFNVSDEAYEAVEGMPE